MIYSFFSLILCRTPPRLESGDEIVETNFCIGLLRIAANLDKSSSLFGKLAILSNSSTYEGLELQTPSGDGSGEFHIGVHQSGATSGRSIVFKRGGSDGMDSESLRIDSSGNVGIGVSSPSAGLHIDNPSNGAITAILDTDNSAV